MVAYGRDRDRVRIDDRSSAPLTVDGATLDRARDRVGSYRNRLIAPRPMAGPIDSDLLARAVVEGIDDCVGQLHGRSTSFALPAWRTRACLSDRSWTEGAAAPGSQGAVSGAYRAVFARAATTRAGMQMRPNAGRNRETGPSARTDRARLSPVVVTPGPAGVEESGKAGGRRDLHRLRLLPQPPLQARVMQRPTRRHQEQIAHVGERGACG